MLLFLQQSHFKVHLTKFLCCFYLFLFHLLFFFNNLSIFAFLMWRSIRNLNNALLLHFLKLTLRNTFLNQLLLHVLDQSILFLQIIDPLLFFLFRLLKHFKEMIDLLSFRLHLIKLINIYFILNDFLTLFQLSRFRYNLWLQANFYCLFLWYLLFVFLHTL